MAGRTNETGSEMAMSDELLSGPPVRGASAIAARIRRAIRTGIYSTGDQLPPERQLAQAFGAARSTIRKVLEMLEEEELVHRRIGSGTFVTFEGETNLATSDVADLTSPLQLIEARFAIEPHMVRLAVIHGTQRDLDHLQAVVRQLARTAHDKTAFTRLDTEFHLLLARCSRNPLIVHLYQQINDIRSHAQWTAMKEVILTPQQIDAYNAQHEAILAAIVKRDAEAAAQHLRDHLDKARNDLVRAGGE